LAGAVNGEIARADVFDDYQNATKQLSEIRSTKEDLSKELENLSGQLNVTDSQIVAISAKISATLKTLDLINQSLTDRRDKVSGQEQLRNEVVRDFYKRSDVVPLILFLGQGSMSAWETWPRRLAYFESLMTVVKNKIVGLNEEITSFEANKKEAVTLKAQLDAQKQQLAAIQNQLKNQAGEIKQKLTNIAAEEAILGQKIDQLSSEISSLMSSQQSAALNVKESGAGRENTPNPDGAPSWRITGYGTEHGVGMSQWGAFMLASKGWDEEKILKYYYRDVEFTTVDINNINVSGFGQLNFEDEYLPGIGETDPVWYTISKDAAAVMDRVQVIAARTYAYDYAKNGKTICTTQACQVYVGGDGKKAAAEATRGKIITYNGQPIRAFYFSTSGPHTDDIGDSPSFAFNSDSRQYKDSGNLNDQYPYLRGVEMNDSASPFNNWSAIIPNSWKSQSYPPKSDFGGGTPVGQIDMTDILNTALLNTTDLERVDSHTSMEDVRKMLRAEGKTPLDSVKSISAVTMGGSSDRVKWITAEGSNRSISEGEITGIRFRYCFNVRSPEKDWIYSTWFELKKV